MANCSLRFCRISGVASVDAAAAASRRTLASCQAKNRLPSRLSNSAFTAAGSSSSIGSNQSAWSRMSSGSVPPGGHRGLGQLAKTRCFCPTAGPLSRDDTRIGNRFTADQERTFPQWRRAGGIGEDPCPHAASFATGPVESDLRAESFHPDGSSNFNSAGPSNPSPQPKSSDVFRSGPLKAARFTRTVLPRLLSSSKGTRLRRTSRGRKKRRQAMSLFGTREHPGSTRAECRGPTDWSPQGFPIVRCKIAPSKWLQPVRLPLPPASARFAGRAECGEIVEVRGPERSLLQMNFRQVRPRHFAVLRPDEQIHVGYANVTSSKRSDRRERKPCSVDMSDGCGAARRFDGRRTGGRESPWFPAFAAVRAAVVA